jgi:hypothetical protein
MHTCERISKVIWLVQAYIGNDRMTHIFSTWVREISGGVRACSLTIDRVPSEECHCGGLACIILLWGRSRQLFGGIPESLMRCQNGALDCAV